MSDSEKNDKLLPETEKNSEDPVPSGDAGMDPKIPPEVFESIVASLAIYRGSALPPNIAEGWEAVLPGSAERLLKLYEQQSEHRKSLELLEMRSAQKRMNKGQWFGFAIAVLSIAAGALISISATVVWGHLCAVLVVTVGVGGPTAARLVIDKWPRIGSSNASSNQ